MIYKLTDLNSWPINLLGWPIFKTTNEAIFYAQLIYDLPEKQDLLDACRQETYKEIKYLRESENPNLDQLMELAVKGQFYRECLEEVQRIKDEKFNH